jgi:hypothetical protein
LKIWTNPTSTWVLHPKSRICQLHRCWRAIFFYKGNVHTRFRHMATSHEIRDGCDSSESDMGFSTPTIQHQGITLQMGIQTEVHCRIWPPKIQTPTCC